jgi:hypothetical protein
MIQIGRNKSTPFSKIFQKNFAGIGPLLIQLASSVQPCRLPAQVPLKNKKLSASFLRREVARTSAGFVCKQSHNLAKAPEEQAQTAAARALLDSRESDLSAARAQLQARSADLQRAQSGLESGRADVSVAVSSRRLLTAREQQLRAEIKSRHAALKSACAARFWRSWRPFAFTWALFTAK